MTCKWNNNNEKKQHVPSQRLGRVVDVVKGSAAITSPAWRAVTH